MTKWLINPLNAELNPIRHLLALVGARHIVHGSRIRINEALMGKKDSRKAQERKFLLGCDAGSLGEWFRNFLKDRSAFTFRSGSPVILLGLFDREVEEAMMLRNVGNY